MYYFFCTFVVVFTYIFKKPFFRSNCSVQSWQGSTTLLAHLQLKFVIITFTSNSIHLKKSYQNLGHQVIELHLDNLIFSFFLLAS